MTAYFDENTSLDSLPETLAGLSTAWARFAPAKARAALIRDGFNPDKLVRFTARPFDIRWAYVETAAKLWNESRPSLVRHALAGARFIMTRRRAPRAEDGTAFYASRSLADQHALFTDAYLLPLVQAPASQPQMGLLDGVLQSEANLSGEARSYLRSIGIQSVANVESRRGHAVDACPRHRLLPAYLTENADGIRLDWPRIPSPAARNYSSPRPNWAARWPTCLIPKPTSTVSPPGSSARR